MKKKVIIIVLLIVAIIGVLFFSTGGKRTDIMIINYTVSEDGTTMTFQAGVASSMGYIRTMREKDDGVAKYLTFYQTFGLNSTLGANDEFQIELDSDCKEIYLYEGPDEYRMVLQKDDISNEWVRVRFK